MIKKLKLILFVIFYLYQTSAFSKVAEEKDFNPKYLSNYLSGIISHNNDNISESVKYFSLSTQSKNPEVYQKAMRYKALTLLNLGDNNAACAEYAKLFNKFPKRMYQQEFNKYCRRNN